MTHLTALENVILSIDVSGMKVKDKKKHALHILNKVELDEDKANRRVLKLSGGGQRRVTIARALSYNPEVIIADEPTGNLDSETEEVAMKILKGLAYEDDKYVIIVTHLSSIAQNVDIVFKLQQQFFNY